MATHPRFRGQGLATTACAALCTSLLQVVDHIGLNVHSDNAAAIACYEHLGFEQVASYVECLFEPPPRGAEPTELEESET